MKRLRLKGITTPATATSRTILDAMRKSIVTFLVDDRNGLAPSFAFSTSQVSTYPTQVTYNFLHVVLILSNRSLRLCIKSKNYEHFVENNHFCSKPCDA